jgi:hypothetical protein
LEGHLNSWRDEGAKRRGGGEEESERARERRRERTRGVRGRGMRAE